MQRSGRHWPMLIAPSCRTSGKRSPPPHCHLEASSLSHASGRCRPFGSMSAREHVLLQESPTSALKSLKHESSRTCAERLRLGTLLRTALSVLSPKPSLQSKALALQGFVQLLRGKQNLHLAVPVQRSVSSRAPGLDTDTKATKRGPAWSPALEHCHCLHGQGHATQSGSNPKPLQALASPGLCKVATDAAKHPPSKFVAASPATILPTL